MERALEYASLPKTREEENGKIRLARQGIEQAQDEGNSECANAFPDELFSAVCSRIG